MNVNCSIDRDSFQQLLADAFEVQQSHLDRSSLSALIELQQLIAKCELSTSEIMQLIAERARTVAGADGAAIAILHTRKLVYQAGSGAASSCIGRQVSAVLSHSTCAPKRNEILRVQNADTDTRIEASICRQFDAQALILFPIYKANTVAGILQISFATAHTFGFQELRTYRLIASLVEDLIAKRRDQAEMTTRLTTATSLSGKVPETSFQRQEIRPNENVQSCSAPLSFRDLNHGYLPDPVSIQRSNRKNVPSTITRPDQTNVGTVWKSMATVGLLVVSIWSWVSYVHTREFSKAGYVSNQLQRNVNNPPHASALADRSDARHLSPSVGTHPRFKRVRVGPNEIDYVTDDVTIRHFLRNSQLPSRAVPSKIVNLADDVTIRYFETTPAVPVPTSATVAKTRTIAPVVVSK